MKFIYNIGSLLLDVLLRFVALFNSKIKKGVEGRDCTFKVLNTHLAESDHTLWFHCASLGEYEQGLPVFKVLRDYYKDYKIVLSFFSPSGYEIRKNSPIADLVVYFPLDTKSNAKRFIDIVKPELTVFVKYDIWPNVLNEINSRGLKAILISAAFRNSQIYFKSYGQFFREALFSFQHIFTQNEVSKTLLNSIRYDNVTVSGDTRFDRVFNQLQIDNRLDFVKEFKGENLCVVAGSSWPEGEEVFANYINAHNTEGVKFIIAPHNIRASQIESFRKQLTVESVLYSEKNGSDLEAAKVFIVDTIGLLSKVYSYADIAYVGGALGDTGLHNILEPAVFGVPIIIGNHHSKFPEAKAMIDNGGVFSISNQKEFDTVLSDIIKDNKKRNQLGELNATFVFNNKGAVDIITKYLALGY